MYFEAFYTGLNNIHVILLVNSYDYIFLMHTEMFMSYTFYVVINNVYLVYVYRSFIHFLVLSPKCHDSGILTNTSQVHFQLQI